MAYATDAGALTPVLMGSGTNDGFFGGGGLGALLIGALLFGGGLGGFNNRGFNQGYGMPAGGYVPGVIQGEQSGALTGIQSQLNALNNTVGQNHIDSELDSLESNIYSGFQSAQTLVGSIGRDILGAVANTATAVTAGNFTTLQSINGLGNQVTASINQGNLQQLNSFNQLGTTVLQGFNELSRDNANGFNQLIMGQNNQNAIMAQCLIAA